MTVFPINKLDSLKILIEKTDPDKTRPSTFVYQATHGGSYSNKQNYFVLINRFNSSLMNE